MRTLDRSDERVFARDDKILEAINIDFERTGLKSAAAAADRNFLLSNLFFFSARVFGRKNEILSLVSTNFRSGESSLANKNLTKCISRNPPF
jgi:hypothetical protein